MKYINIFIFNCTSSTVGVEPVVIYSNLYPAFSKSSLALSRVPHSSSTYLWISLLFVAPYTCPGWEEIPTKF